MPDPSRPNSRRNSQRRRHLRRLNVEALEPRLVFATPYGAMPDDTGEFLLGDVVVTPVLFESNGQLDPNTENWSDALKQSVQQRITDGVRWWSDTLTTLTSVHRLNFIIDDTYIRNPIDTAYEPIARRSDDFLYYIYDFLGDAGFNQAGNYETDIRAFNHAQVVKHNADFAFTILIANDANDSDGQFQFGGSFRRAFSFPGGQLTVAPASRPSATFAHELGHQFWAMDEYGGGDSYTTRRGYYNAQSLNSADNPTAGFQQQTSIMAGSLADAFLTHTTPASTLAFVGWRDSDGDGIFDVLDVPLSLTGSGHFNPATNDYIFVGRSSVQTLPNRNSSGLQNDITLNQVSRAEYRIDGGTWQTAQTYFSYDTAVNLRIPMPTGSQSIEIRTKDDATGVTSPVFSGSKSRSDLTAVTGISGFVFDDADGDRQFDPGEQPLPGWTVRLVDSGLQPLALVRRLDPEDFAEGAAIGNAIPEATLISTGIDSFSSTVTSRTNNAGQKVFASDTLTNWTTGRNLRINFASPTTTVSIDALGAGTKSYGRLEIYDSANNLLARDTTGLLTAGQRETLTLSRPSPDIAYAIVKGHANTNVHLDNLRFGPETTVQTNDQGAYTIPSLSPGTYTVQVVAPNGATLTVSAQTQSVSYQAGQNATQKNFAAEAEPPGGSIWQNPVDAADVNNDGHVTPIDALLVINVLVAHNGSYVLTNNDPTPPFVDVNGDGKVTANDALQVVNRLISRADSAASGEPDDSTITSAPATESYPSAAAQGEPVVEVVSASRTRGLGERVVPRRSSQPLPDSRPIFVAGPFASRAAEAITTDDTESLDGLETWWSDELDSLVTDLAQDQLTT